LGRGSKLPDSSSSLAEKNQVNRVYLYFVCLVAAVGGFIFGYDLDILTGALIFLRREFNLTPAQLGFAVSSATIGCIFGPLVGGSAADWLGRKRTLALTALVFAVGAIGTVFPKVPLEFDAFRLLGGIGVGLASIVSPMYISEISPAAIRGRLVTVNQLAIVMGSLLAIVVAYFFSFSGNWRGMFASELVPVILFVVGLAFVPESPRWLLQKGRYASARDVLLKVHVPEAAEREFEEIAQSIGGEESKTKLAELVGPGLRKALLIAIVLAVLQQLTGVSPLTFYMPVIFQEAGFRNASDAIMQTIIVNAWSMLWTVVALWLVDRIGRRFLLLVGTLGMGVGMAAMGVSFQFKLSGAYVVLVMMASMAFVCYESGSIGMAHYV